MRAINFILWAGAFLFCLMLLHGCDPVVSERPVGPPTFTDRTVSCDRPGYCYMCMGVRMSGGLGGCGFAFHYNCPGEQAARVKVQTMLGIRQSGKMENYDSEEVVQTLGECE